MDDLGKTVKNGILIITTISPGERNGNPLQYSCLENPMDREVWQAPVHGIIRVRHDLVTKPLFLHQLL